VTTSIPGSTGAYSFARASATWTWSEQVFAIFGFTPGDVVPTTDLVLSHQHPEDRADVERLLSDVAETGRPYSCWHRIVDANGDTRQVVAVGAGDFDDDGTLLGVSGLLVDVTEEVRRTTAREVDEAMELMSQSRPAIEQAKGALMMAYGLDSDDAFLLLRRYSQHVNVKVRDVARNITEALPDGDLPLGSRATWDEIAADLRRDDLEEQPGA
jgi:hypothetical protein